MSTANIQPHRTLGVRPGFSRAPRSQTGQPAAGKKPRDWSQGFEMRALLVVGEPVHPSTPTALRCKHVRGDDTVIGEVVARFRPWEPPPACQTRVEVGATVAMCNGPRGPLARLTVHRWTPK